MTTHLKDCLAGWILISAGSIVPKAWNTRKSWHFRSAMFRNVQRLWIKPPKVRWPIIIVVIIQRFSRLPKRNAWYLLLSGIFWFHFNLPILDMMLVTCSSFRYPSAEAMPSLALKTILRVFLATRRTRHSAMRWQSPKRFAIPLRCWWWPGDVHSLLIFSPLAKTEDVFGKAWDIWCLENVWNSSIMGGVELWWLHVKTSSAVSEKKAVFASLLRNLLVLTCSYQLLDSKKKYLTDYPRIRVHLENIAASLFQRGLALQISRSLSIFIRMFFLEGTATAVGCWWGVQNWVCFWHAWAQI